MGTGELYRSLGGSLGAYTATELLRAGSTIHVPNIELTQQQAQQFAAMKQRQAEQYIELSKPMFVEPEPNKLLLLEDL